MAKILKYFCTLFVILILQFQYSLAQDGNFKKFPKEADPKTIGQKIAVRYLSFPFRNFGGIENIKTGEVTYPEVCTWLGALRFAKVSKDKNLLQQLERRYYPLLNEQKKLTPKPDHVDHSVFGSIPLELYMQTGNDVFFHIGMNYADEQWIMPSNTKHEAEYKKLLDLGLSWQTRYWIDDMFMISTIQSQAYLASKDREYIDRAAFEMTHYLDSIQRPNGLFYHAGNAPFFWARGNGWMAAGMTDLLKNLPEDNQYRERILIQYRKMMETLKAYQRADGMWGQLVDDPSSWAETSGTGMFAYAMITGVKRGWLDKETYAPIAKKAWIALVSYINENNDIKDVCEGTNVGTTKEYYLNRKRITGDMHGQAPLIWCATAFLEK
ncbi:hypothetical protein FACS1894174_03230 [Bacteroidia bacterium]|nr:hypothetical protein FACS1894155_06780 [Bacteroidia bacterium]GHV20762.1 hypothetical protein FACS1894174_03230 [Bacteroidia bacterium]